MLRTTGGFSRPYSPVQPVGAAFGAAFLLLGTLGFVPGVTTGLAGLGALPASSGAALFATLPVSLLLNALLLALGLAGLAAARSTAATRGYLVAGAGPPVAAAALLATTPAPAGSPQAGAALLVLLAAAMLGSALLLHGRPVVGRAGRGAAPS